MYGSEKTDLLVKYYDDAFGLSGNAEINWYLNVAKTFGGPVLDLACGTGRLSILLARQGYAVTAIDQSLGMLSQLEVKLQAQPSDVQNRISRTHQTMAGFKLGQQFNTILCVDAFFHNLTVQTELDCLTQVRQHLAPDGCFVFNLPNPNLEFIQSCLLSKGEKFSERSRNPISGSADTLLVEEANSCDVSEQLVCTRLRLTRTNPQGNVIEKGESTWTTRFLYKYEAIHLLYRCGFEVETLVGDYQNGPITPTSQLIFQARLHP